MSHTDYNSLSTKVNSETPASKENNLAPEDKIVTPNETPESTNQVETSDNPVDPEVESEYILGTVTDCKKLNVREEPSINAQILFEIAKDSHVLIDPDESTDEWYKVHIDERGGFCMKKYILI